MDTEEGNKLNRDNPSQGKLQVLGRGSATLLKGNWKAYELACFTQEASFCLFLFVSSLGREFEFLAGSLNSVGILLWGKKISDIDLTANVGLHINL